MNNIGRRMETDEFYYDQDIEHIAEVLKNRLFFAVTYDDLKKTLRCTSNALYFCTDDELLYMSYYFDFGPLNISCLYKFCCKVNSFLQCTPVNKKIVYYTRNNECTRVNSAFLMGSYAVIYLDLDPRQVYRMLLNAGGPFRTFVDASQGTSQYTIRLLDCLLAIEKARSFQFFNFNDFNVLEYDTYDRLQNGDMNWLLPRKFLAFIGPTDNELMNSHPPSFYIKYFQKNDIRTVIRLNNKLYNENVFLQAGINHYDLIFPDGTTPPKSILLRFLEISERTPHAIAVHCKAGLGRTGSLIGAFIIKHYKFTAREAIAWMRICRPGSVIGQQQGWLEKIEAWLWRQGSHYRIQHFGEGDKIPTHKYGIYSKMWPLDRKKILLFNRKRDEERENQRTGNSMPRHIITCPNVKMHIASANESNKRHANSAREKDKRIQQNKFHGNDSSVSRKSLTMREECRGECPRRNRSQLRQLSADSSSSRRFSDRRTYEATQGDRLNEVKLRRHLTEAHRKNVQQQQQQQHLKQQQQQQQQHLKQQQQQQQHQMGRSDSRIRSGNRAKYGKDDEETQFSEDGSSVHRFKARQTVNVRDMIAGQEARKRVLEMLSPLKMPTIERMYKRS